MPAKDSHQKLNEHKDRYRKILSNKRSKIIPNTSLRPSLAELTTVAEKMAKEDGDKNSSPMLMTTIDSDGIKSVTSAAGNIVH